MCLQQMDVIKLTEILTSTRQSAYRDDDFFLDRLSHRVSVVVFVVFACLITTKSYIGEPIDCWSPPEFKASYERYAETVCFINGSYFISINQYEVPVDDGRYSHRIRYYQWTPFILLLQAAVMYLPRFVWLSFSVRHSLNTQNLIDAARKYHAMYSHEQRQKVLEYIARNLMCGVFRKTPSATRSTIAANSGAQERHSLLLRAVSADDANEMRVDRHFRDSRPHSIACDMQEEALHMQQQHPHTERRQEKRFQSPSSANYLTRLYTLVRLAYLMSAAGQFAMLSHLIGNGYYRIGLDFLMSYVHEEQWPQLPIFPKFTLCEIYIKELGTTHPYLIQCVLRINLFNELIFIVMWFWLLALIVLNACDACCRLVVVNWRTCGRGGGVLASCETCKRRRFAVNYLQQSASSGERTANALGIVRSSRARCLTSGAEDNNAGDKENKFDRFCNDYFNDDTMFSLRLIETNVSSLIVGDIVEYLWLNYQL